MLLLSLPVRASELGNVIGLVSMCGSTLSLYICVQKNCNLVNKTLGRAQDPRANSAWLSKLTE